MQHVARTWKIERAIQDLFIRSGRWIGGSLARPGLDRSYTVTELCREIAATDALSLDDKLIVFNQALGNALDDRLGEDKKSVAAMR